ncbi:MAG: AEC family transporter [Rhodospirillaceae bacterium]
MFAAIVPVLTPVLLTALIGYLWARTNRPFDTETITQIALTIATPALVLDTLMAVDLPPQNLGTMVLASLMVHGGLMILGLGLNRSLGQPNAVFLPGFTFGNTGNMGLPLCLFAFGETGLGLAIAFFTTTTVINLVLTPVISSGRPPLKALYGSPLVWSVVIALSLRGLGVELPLFVDNTVGLLAGLTIPMMLLALGVSLARLKASTLRVPLLIGGLKPILGFGLGFLVVLVLELDGMARGVVLIQAAMPIAVFNYLLAAQFKQKPEEVAATVVVSTLLTFVCLPLVLGIAMVPQ